jgi:antirestriction protein ArdC
MENIEKAKHPNWMELFKEALEKPGMLSECYSVFHEYSLGNRVMARIQMLARNIPMGPIATFKKWDSLGRKVKKGEKAISLLMPVSIGDKKEEDDRSKDVDSSGSESSSNKRVLFITRPRWFALAQTDGDDDAIPSSASIPDWDKNTALSELGLKEVDFDLIDGNCQGYAIPNKGVFAINPLAASPMKTTFHEIAHCLLHTKEAQMADGGTITRDIKEAEAESVAYLCCASLGMSSGLDESIGYIQNWLDKEKTEEFAKKSASRIFSCADKILKAGLIKEAENE